ncbi:hypothetical protein TrVGV298_010179 [Trichoderma virens]|nr:hypothetical protein TrVGV298_010179 [Trichoderma virens]
MPTRTRKRKASEEEGAEVGEVAQPAKKTARATQKKPRVNQEQSSKGGDSSKRVRAGPSNSAAGNASKKSKSASSSSRSVKNEIRRNADELIHMIEDRYYNTPRSGTIGSISLRSNITTTLQDDLGTQNIVYQKSHNCIKALQGTIAEYEVTTRDLVNISKPTEGAQWEQDAKDVAKVDKKAMEILIQTLNGLIISGGHANSLRSPPRSGDDIEQAAWRLLLRNFDILLINHLQLTLGRKFSDLKPVRPLPSP